MKAFLYIFYMNEDMFYPFFLNSRERLFFEGYFIVRKEQDTSRTYPRTYLMFLVQMGCLGLEPRTYRLKAEYSTIELATPNPQVFFAQGSFVRISFSWLLPFLVDLILSGA